nr:CRISPR-associated endonuclease Cas2 [Thermosipho globiformans]
MIYLRYLLVVYDVNEKRVNKIHKILKKYLVWQQNSTFEGYLSQSNIKKLFYEVKNKIDEKEDSVVIYFFNSNKVFRKVIDGKEKYIFNNHFI